MGKHVVGLSGGKDSSALSVALNQREPRDYEYIFTPTGDELPEMHAHLAYLERLLGKSITRLDSGYTLDSLIAEVGMLPKWNARFCTRVLKIEPTLAYMATLPPGSVLYVGLRADEEERRGIYGDDVTCDFPFRRWGWGVEQVWQCLDDAGVSIPARTDCARCYHQRLEEWRNLYRNHPAIYASAEAQEARVGHTFRSPGRDNWPSALAELRVEFDKGRKIRGEGKAPRSGRCRVCSL